MGINLGEENISEEQRHHLVRSRRRLPMREIVRILHRVVTNSGIVSGQEDLHPEWVSVFERHRAELGECSPIAGCRGHPHATPCLRRLTTYPFIGVYHRPNRKQDIVFLLGAGASKPSPSGIPTVTELLPELLNRARRLDREQVTNLADFCDKQQIYRHRRSVDSCSEFQPAVQSGIQPNTKPR